MNQSDKSKERSRGISFDMSPEAISRRLDIVSELRKFTKFLSTAKKIEPKTDAKSSDSRQKMKNYGSTGMGKVSL